MEQDLFDACGCGRYEEVEAILQHPDIDINSKNDEDRRWACLHAACSEGHLSIVKLLLAHPDIDVNLADKYRGVPFYYACVSGHVAVVRLMLNDSRVLVNVQSTNGYTPLSVAAAYGYLELIQWVVASGKDLDLGHPGELSDVIGNSERVETWHSASQQLKMSKVATLLERFKHNPAQTRHEVRLELGWSDQIAADHFSLVVFLCDGLLAVSSSTELGSARLDAKRYFLIAQQLPMELQMLLCHRVAGSGKDNIKTEDSESAFKNLAHRI